MKVAVFGLGYVGSVTAACLAARGNDVVGVDISPKKVELIANGETPVLEPGLAQLIAEQVGAGRLRATVDAREAVESTDVALICVGTPSLANGSLDTEALVRTAQSIGEALAGRRDYTVVVRSTVLPGTTEGVVIPELPDGVGVVCNPEFLREGTSLADFADPPKTVIGESDPASGDVVAALFEGLPGPVFRVAIPVAEMVKYVDNAFHATKIAFANEIGAVARAFDVDSHAVMEIVKADRKLNVSEAYMTPGFAFGGSCLPKDLRALLHAAGRRDVDLPLLESVLPSNEVHLQRVVDAVLAHGRRKVAIIGLSFKPGTDDLRESPLVELAERLLGKGCQLKIYDSEVSLSQLVGANRDYIESRIPHLSALLVDSVDEALADADVCVVGAPSPDALHALASSNGRLLVDLVRLPDADRRRGSEGYVGVAW
jgi:GDP-mannose 6-dehydrogenase